MKILSFILTLLLLVNCYSYKAVTTDSNSSPTPELSKTYSITLKQGGHITATNVRQDSGNYLYTDRDNQEKTLAKDSVAGISEKKFSYGKTIGLVGGSIVVGTVVLFGATLAAFSNSIN